MDRRWLAGAVGLALGLVAALALAEIMLRVIVDRAGYSFLNYVQDHPALGRKVAPDAPGYDEWGFRNPSVPDGVEVLMLGDSLVHGNGVSLREAVPYRLAELTGRPAYNMALGGYTPLEYLHLYREYGRKLGPQVVVVGFSPGTDLWEVVAARGRIPELGLDPDVLPDTRPDLGDIRRHYAEVKDAYRPDYPLQTIDGWSRNLKLYSLFARVTGFDPQTWYSFYEDWERELREARSELSSHGQWMVDMGLWLTYEDENIRTMFTPLKRLYSVLYDREDTKAAMVLSQQALSTLRREAERDGARLFLTFVPTKEAVYSPYLEQRGVALPESFSRLMHHTDEVRRVLERFAAEEGVPFLDVTPPLQEAAMTGVLLYPETADGHPNALGHQIWAEAQAAQLGQQGTP